MQIVRYLLVFGVIFLFHQNIFTQSGELKGDNEKSGPATTATTGQNQEITRVPREKRQEAYARLLEGQRYIWSMSRLRSAAVLRTGARLARESLQKAVELDPTLAEGYTALAELSYYMRPQDLEEAERLARIAVKINQDNFGGHQLLAKIYTEKSRINRGVLDQEYTRLAIRQWNEVARMDKRNAEAFAFLSALYGQTGDTKRQIESLKNWIAASTPLDTRFYRQMMGRGEQLTPESAMVRLGAVLIKENRSDEAVEVLSRAVAENSDDEETIELLDQALESAGTSTVKNAIEALQQAVFANPDNVSLVSMLARAQSRAGDTAAAAKTLRQAILRLTETDTNSAAELQILLGDLYQRAARHEEAAANYKLALAFRGIETNQLIRDEDRRFAIRVYEKLIQTYKNANRPEDVRDVISRARILFGDKDMFADKM